MNHNWVFKSGDWNILCDRCNIRVKASEVKKEWTGFIVCESCWEPRHPQDFIRPTIDKITVPFTRPRSEDTFVDVCTITGRSAYAGYSVAGCMIAGLNDDSLHEYEIVIEDFFPAIAGLMVAGYSIAGTIESEANSTQGL